MLGFSKQSMSVHLRAALALALLTLPLAAATDSLPSTTEEDDEVGFFQKPIIGAAANGSSVASAAKATNQFPVLIPLRKESVPIERGGKIVAHKTSYSGAISVGRPAQEFRVVFDTGSGHVIVPSTECESESCLVHRRYSLAASKTSTAVNADGSAVPPEELGDQVTVGFATGKVTGEFVRDQVCVDRPGEDLEVCVEVSVIMASEMTTQPFKAFNFDGIFGLGLAALAVDPDFNYLHRFAGMGFDAASQFGFFIADGGGVAGEEGGEVAVGGYNSERLLTPLKWAPVAMKDHGHWQVEIKEVRIGNHILDLCQDGTCRGVVDTGTSHFGVPGKGLDYMQQLLTAPALSDDEDCRQAEAPTVELVLEGLTLTLGPENYMRPLPLDHVLTKTTKKELQSSKSCTPRLMPVNMPAPMGPNLFLLGGPVLHRYYTVYDWKSSSIGFGLAATEGNRAQLAEQGLMPTAGQEQGQKQEEEPEVFSFMQVTVTLSVRSRKGSARARASRSPEGLALPLP